MIYIISYGLFPVVELRQQLETTEKESDEEKQKLAQELSRGKQAVISLMQVCKGSYIGTLWRDQAN